jgi:diguanylate cyclase (GGDEF)-like protein/PAS domain S-box-containing protein
MGSDSEADGPTPPEGAVAAGAVMVAAGALGAAQAAAGGGSRLLATLWHMAQVAVLVTDAQLRIVAVNPAFEQLTGYAEHEVLGAKPSLLQSGLQPHAFYEAMWQALGAHGVWQGEITNRRKDGTHFHEFLKIQAIRADEGGQVRCYVATFNDLTLEKAAQSQAQHLASHDLLTGLPNLLLMRDRAGQAMGQVGSGGCVMAVMLLDLDHFKAINDSLGQAGGDELLRQIGHALSTGVTSAETVSRRGGDEFVVLFPSADATLLPQMAQRVLVALADPFAVNGREAVVSASVGVAVYPSDGADFDTLLSHAEVAMYQAKESGRRCIRFFTDDMNQGARGRMDLLSDLSRAVSRGELRLHFQPVVNLASSVVVGAEALVRWERPGVGLVPPSEFIALAESSGLIMGIGQWVLNEACQHLERWRSMGLGHLHLAVNVSAMQFRQGQLEQQVSDALERSGCDPSRLELELTESVLMVRPDEVMAVIRRLKQRGVQLSIDDFGTGYSSLAYLRRLAVDKLKIDQSFVRDLTIDPDGAAIVRAVIQMARSLGLKTVGEGVETQVNRRALQVLGCDLGQGYFFGRPIGVADFEQAALRSSAVGALPSSGLGAGGRLGLRGSGLGS